MERRDRTPVAAIFVRIDAVDRTNLTSDLVELTASARACATEEQARILKDDVESANFSLKPDGFLATSFRPRKDRIDAVRREIATLALSMTPHCRACTNSGNCELEKDLW